MPRRLALVVVILASLGCDQDVDVRVFGDVRGERFDAGIDGRSTRVGWAISLGGPGADGAGAIALAPDGNVIVTGDLHGSARFGDHTLVATHADGGGSFVAKVDASSGRVLWATPLEAEARMAGDLLLSSRHSMLNDVAVNRKGEIVVGAHFRGSVAIAGTTRTAEGAVDALVVKLSSSGQVLWARTIGGPGDDLVQAVALDDAGEVTATGMFDGTADFDGATRTARGGRDSFVVRYASNGALRCATAMGSESPDDYPGGGRRWEYGFGVALDPAGNAYVSGKFIANATFGPVPLSAEPKFGYATYLAKLDPSGEIVRAEEATRLGLEVGPRRLAFDASLGLRLAGMIESKGVNYPLVFAIDPAADPFTWSPAALSTPGNATGVAIGGGQVAIAGVLGGKGQVGPKTLIAAGGNDVLVARLDAKNHILGGESAGGPGDDGGNGVAIDAAGNLYVVGWFSDTARFGDTTLISAGGYDGFVWKLPAAEP